MVIIPTVERSNDIVNNQVLRERTRYNYIYNILHSGWNATKLSGNVHIYSLVIYIG